ncbi:MAG: ABC transporter substrate-binding protein [Bacteroidales bacterium]|nr:ABC transporter substrate-binding protein [Bacteroidales bacterium]
MKKIPLFILLMLFPGTFLFTQTMTPVPVQISEHIENIDGRYYILHTVKPQQTLFSISRAYGVAIEQIRRTSDMPSIQVDEILFIPTSPPPTPTVIATPPPTPEIQEPITQTPQAPQTRRERRQATTVVITEYKVETETEIETDYEYDYTDTARRVFDNPPRSVLNVALMLPLYLGEVDRIRITPTTNRNAIRPFSFIGFYQGAKLAAQKFYCENVEINVHVFDVTEDTNTAVRLINSGRLRGIDIIVGPFFARSFSVMSYFAKQREIFIINPTSIRTEILDDNPFVIKINTSIQNQLQALLNYAAKNSVGQRIFILSNDSLPNEREFSEQARQFFDGIEYRFNNVYFLDISQERFQSLQRNLATQTGNSFIFLSNDDAFVTSILTLTPRRDHIPNTLYSLRRSPRFEVTDPFYLNNLQTHYIEPFFINHNDERVRNFDQLFFRTFQTVPDMWAYRGFDVMSYVFKLLRIGNTNYGNYLESTLHKGFHNYIQLKWTSPYRGLENQQTNILRIQNSVLQKVSN